MILTGISFEMPGITNTTKTVEVSIIMSIHNGEKWLHNAVDSVLAQTFSNFEFIIVDDASTDQSNDLINRYVLRDSRIKLLVNPVNIGLTKSLNKALNIARGNFIARIDVDDVWKPDKLEKQIEFMRNHKDIGLLGTAYEEIDEVGRYKCEQTVKLCVDDKEIRKSISVFNPFLHSSVFFRREIYDELGGYNEKYIYAQDYEYWVRILDKYKASNLENKLAFRRIGEHNVSYNKEKKQRLFAIRAKIIACRTHGMSLQTCTYLLRDLAVVLLPVWIVNRIRM